MGRIREERRGNQSKSWARDRCRAGSMDNLLLFVLFHRFWATKEHWRDELSILINGGGLEFLAEGVGADLASTSSDSDGIRCSGSFGFRLRSIDDDVQCLQRSRDRGALKWLFYLRIIKKVIEYHSALNENAVKRNASNASNSRTTRNNSSSDFFIVDLYLGNGGHLGGATPDGFHSILVRW